MESCSNKTGINSICLTHPPRFRRISEIGNNKAKDIYKERLVKYKEI